MTYSWPSVLCDIILRARKSSTRGWFKARNLILVIVVLVYWIWTGALAGQLAQFMYTERSINKHWGQHSPSCGKHVRKTEKPEIFTNQKYDNRKPFSCQISSPKKSCFMNNLNVTLLQTWVSEIFIAYNSKPENRTWNVPRTQDITKRAGEKNRHDLVILSY